MTTTKQQTLARRAAIAEKRLRTGQNNAHYARIIANATREMAEVEG